jgi:hypothetical protein
MQRFWYPHNYNIQMEAKNFKLLSAWKGAHLNEVAAKVGSYYVNTVMVLSKSDLEVTRRRNDLGALVGTAHNCSCFTYYRSVIVNNSVFWYEYILPHRCGLLRLRSSVHQHMLLWFHSTSATNWPNHVAGALAKGKTCSNTEFSRAL